MKYLWVTLSPVGEGRGEGNSIRVLASSSNLFRILAIFFCLLQTIGAGASTASALFQTGVTAYRAGEYAVAATAFRQAAELRPASGTLQNLGSAEWQRGNTGAAILAWERARWLDPFNASISGNLRYARKTAQLESPELAWYEVVSTWLPVNWWAWLAGLSLWLALGLVFLPGIFRRRKRAWHQAVAAVGFAVFLLSVPAHLGVNTRCRIGFVLAKDTPLRLTPTREAQSVTRLAGGEPARLERARGDYFFIRTSRASGWVKRDELGLVSDFPLSVRSAAPRVAGGAS